MIHFWPQGQKPLMIPKSTTVQDGLGQSDTVVVVAVVVVGRVSGGPQYP